MDAEGLPWPSLAKAMLQEPLPFSRQKAALWGQGNRGLSSRARQIMSRSLFLRWVVGVITNKRTEIRHLESLRGNAWLVLKRRIREGVKNQMAT